MTHSRCSAFRVTMGTCRRRPRRRQPFTAGAHSWSRSVRAFLALVGGAAISVSGLLLVLASDLDLLGATLIAIGAMLAALGRRGRVAGRGES